LALALSATTIPDTNEMAIITAVSHRQPRCFLVLFPLVMSSPRNWLLVFQAQHPQVPARSS
jgi:hypothetical protein